MSIADQLEQKGIRIGREEAMMEVAVRLLESKASLETVMIATGFTQREVLKVSNEVHEEKGSYRELHQEPLIRNAITKRK